MKQWIIILISLLLIVGISGFAYAEDATTDKPFELFSFEDDFTLGVDQHFFLSNQALATGISWDIASMFNDQLDIKAHYVPEFLNTDEEAVDLYGLGLSANVIQLCEDHCGDIKLNFLSDIVGDFEVDLGVAYLIDMNKAISDGDFGVVGKGEFTIYFKVYQAF